MNVHTNDEAVTAYCDELLMALRMKDVPGERIGAVLSETRAHLTDSGEDPVEAFGTPTEYAAALTAGTASPAPRAKVIGLLRSVALVLGLWFAVGGGSALATGDRADVTVAPFVVAVLAAFGAPFLVGRIATGTRTSAALWGGAMLLVATLLGVGSALVDLPVLAQVHGGVLLAVGLLLVAATALGDGLDPDPVVDPLTRPSDVRAQRRRTTVLLAIAQYGTLAVAVAGVILVARLLD
ncbi:MAG TPA: hypothetical protein VF661_10695 [Actinomycetales bacterium]|jgi:hypothetical protein